jgi:hypothetical protein
MVLFLGIYVAVKGDNRATLGLRVVNKEAVSRDKYFLMSGQCEQWFLLHRVCQMNDNHLY